MLLELRYSEKVFGEVAAAIIPGNDPSLWLIELGRWGINPMSLKCFVMPESISSTKANGLFIIFSDPVKDFSPRYPYCRLSDGFFIPINASLYPEVLPDEIKARKLWDVQVFHPTIGLVGFEAKDEVKVSGLITMPEPYNYGWLTAFPSLSLYPQLKSINLEAEEHVLNAIDALKAQIDKQELSNIPKDDAEKKTFIQKLLKILSIMGLWLLLLLAFVGKIIFAIPEVFLNRQSGSPASQSAKAGWLQRLEKWVGDRLKDIQKQRDSELNRLVKLFDKNNEEALMYAIPLNSSYLNRGIAPKSGKLGKRDLKLNLKGFGNGGAADQWELGNYREMLRQKYIESANKNIEKGDYKKAAYIYAHLLGDLSSAAKVLQDGKHYREAAAIYKDHLSNLPKAAECLINGGLLTEAIPIYVEMHSFEKAGDLYIQLGQQEEAQKYYQDSVDRCINSKDYINAARLKIEKMGELDDGKTILLDGWKDDNQSELCLKKYLEVATQLDDEIKYVYKKHTWLRKKTTFLTVLSELPKLRHDEHLKATALNIAYEIVNQQATRGDYSTMRLLTKFLPEDKLLNQDSNRYILNNHSKSITVFEIGHIQLREDIQWHIVENYHEQLIGIGTKNEELFLLRANLNGETTYELLLMLAGDVRTLRLIGDGYTSKAMLLIGKAIPIQTEKRFGTSTYFDRELNFFQLNWTPPHALAFGLKSDLGELFMLYLKDENLCLDKFNMKGDVLSGSICRLNDEMTGVYNMPYLRFSGMYWRKDHFYLTGRKSVIRVKEDGEMENLALDAEVFDFSISSPHAAFKIAVITEKGCVLISPGLKGMHITGDFFAVDIGAFFVKLLTDNKLILANNEQAWVYDISGQEPRLFCEIQPENRILKILNIPKRHHFALLEEDQRITIHCLPED